MNVLLLLLLCQWFPVNDLSRQPHHSATAARSDDDDDDDDDDDADKYKAIEDSRLRLPSLSNACFASGCVWRGLRRGMSVSGSNAEMGGASGLRLRLSLRCLPLTDSPLP